MPVTLSAVAALLVVGLSVAGGLAATLTPAPQVAVADQSQSALLRTGQQLYETACITCHGANLQGVQGRGPSLIGVGEASVFFQVSTGRMPAMLSRAFQPRTGAFELYVRDTCPRCDLTRAGFLIATSRSVAPPQTDSRSRWR